jgi:GNAT superfamily N-acetyltransferase
MFGYIARITRKGCSYGLYFGYLSMTRGQYALFRKGITPRNFLVFQVFVRAIDMPDNLYTIQNHTPEQIDALGAFIERYRTACPDAKLFSAGLYTYHPGAQNGQNVFCAYDDQGLLRGFAPLFPAPVGEDSAPADSHHIWTILLADPERGDGQQIRESLLPHVLQRANALAASFPSFRRTRLASDMMVSQRADIAFLEQNGFARYDGMYVMQRPPAKPIPEIQLPQGLVVRCGKLGSSAEQEQYLQAFNQCFPGNPKTLASLRFQLDPLLRVDGTTISIFTPSNDLIASILVYSLEQDFGVTDDVFVLPAWRGRNIARFLIGEGLKYFQERDITDMRLEVMQNNLPAVRVYTSMGYEVINEEVFLGRFMG